jgi:hypothetical protein
LIFNVFTLSNSVIPENIPYIRHPDEDLSSSVIPANEVVKKSIVSAMFSEHPRFILESNSDQLKNKPNGRPLFHNLERRDPGFQPVYIRKVWVPTYVGMTGIRGVDYSPSQ